MSTDRVKSEEYSKENRPSAPIDLLDASLEEMLFLEGIGEVSAKKIISIRETGIPLTMDLLGRIPHFSIKRMQALMAKGLVRPLMSDCYDEDDDDEEEAKSVTSTTADRWYSILKSEREEMDRVRLDRDRMRMRYEMSEFTKQKEEEMNHILRRKEMEMEKRLRTSFEGLTSARTTTSSRSRPNLESARGESTVSQDMSTKDDPAQEERRKIQELARNVPTDSIYRGRAFDKRSPLGTSTPNQYQHATSNPDAASSVEMRKSDTSTYNSATYNSARDTRTSVSTRSVTPVRVAEEQHEDSSSSDESLSSDVPSETESDTSDEAQARSRGSYKSGYQSARHSTRKHKERRRPRSPPAPKLPTFTGATGTWQSFSFQFKEIASMHQWSKRTRLERLMSCLSDKAVKFVERLKKDDRREYGPLFKALSKRFGKCDPPSTLRKQITTAVQGSDESLEEWADRIWALTLDGFPEATDTLVEKLAVEYFFKGCHDNQAALAVSGGRHKIRTVQKAVKAMKKYVCTSQQLLGSKASTYSHRQRQVTFQDTHTKVGSTPTITSDAIKEIVRSALSDATAKMMSTMEQNILDKLTMRNKSPPRNRSPSPTITCFKCRKPGHYARECPLISPPSSPRQTRCFKCQEYGHIQRDCPKHLQVSESSPNDTGLGK